MSKNCVRNFPSALKHFGELVDPRINRQKLHLLTDIVVVTICAVICGADEWTEIAEFGRAKEKWFRTILELPNGIPSHDTFGRVFSLLDPEQFRLCFQRWIQCVRTKTNGEVIAIDGKALRGSFDTASSKAAIHMVSAWSSKNRLVLGQIKVDEKSNEITAVPRLLELLDLSGCIVTMDAMGCQKEHAKQIISKNADYVFALKGNQGNFHEEVQEFYLDAIKFGFENVPHQLLTDLPDKDHGRIETRKYWLITDVSMVSKSDQWRGLNGVGMVEATRMENGRTSKETRFFCTSLRDVETFSRAVREHWGIENGLHWNLDVSFNEDDSRIRKDNAPENLARVRHVALNLLKQETSVKIGIKGKRLKAGWNEAYLAKVLNS
jgi:predicted transposase YbfD/YdcC